jgi:hypothetical protein
VKSDSDINRTAKFESFQIYSYAYFSTICDVAVLLVWSSVPGDVREVHQGPSWVLVGDRPDLLLEGEVEPQ